MPGGGDNKNNSGSALGVIYITPLAVEEGNNDSCYIDIVIS